MDHEPEFYVFCVLRGIATACYVFTKVMRPLVKYWRQQGIHVVVYLDDGLVAVKGVQNATKVSTVVQQDLIKAGWVENVTKSEWVPSRQQSWLGFNIDLEKGTIEVPQIKLDNFRAQLLMAAEHKDYMPNC